MSGPTDQLELFAPTPGVAALPPPPPTPPAPAAAPVDVVTLGQRLPPEVRLGTSSWSFPGWAGLVYAERATADVLARDGLAAYAGHPVLRTVGIDRTFYGPVAAEVFRGWAEAVPEGFRFLVKAHEALTLARFPRHPRYGARGGEENPLFLEPGHARDLVIAPMVEGLGAKAGPLVFQFPPQELTALGGPSGFADRLHAFLSALPAGPLYAVEVRNAALLGPELAAVLDDVGAVPVLAGWGPLPRLPAQALALRAEQAAALVVRWMLPPHLGYDEAKSLYEPFDRLVAEDLGTRQDIAGLISRAVRAGKPAFVTINNKAEGSAPLSAVRLAEAIVTRLSSAGRTGPRPSSS